MYNDPIFNEGLAGFDRGGFHLFDGPWLFCNKWTGPESTSKLKDIKDTKRQQRQIMTNRH